MRNVVLPQDTTHLIQRPHYQRGSLCQDPTGNRTTRKCDDHHKETQTEVVWTCFPVIRSVSRSSGQAKTILLGTVNGGRRQSRQKKRREENVREWTGLEFAESQRAVENRKNRGNWLWSHLWCLSDPRGWEIGEGEGELRQISFMVWPTSDHLQQIKENEVIDMLADYPDRPSASRSRICFFQYVGVAQGRHHAVTQRNLLAVPGSELSG